MSLEENEINIKKQNISDEEMDLDDIRYSDPQLVRMAKFALPPNENIDVPVSVEKVVMDSYRKHNRYRIILRDIKLKIKGWKSLLVLNREVGIKLVFTASTILLLVMGATSLYYRYGNYNYKNPGLTSNKETPAVNVETPATPLPTPKITPTTNNSIAENNSNKSNEEANQGSKTTHRPEPIKSLKLEEDKLALNRSTEASNRIRKPGEKGNNDNTNLTNKGLRDINIVMISDSVELGVRQGIEKEIIESGKWKLAGSGKDGEATFKVVGNSLMLVNESGKILWQDAKYKENLYSNPIYLKSIIKLLTK